MTAELTDAARAGADQSPGRPAGPSARRLVPALGVTQTVGYGALVIALAVLITPMARDLGVRPASIAFGTTIEVLLGAAVAVPVGRILDRHGGRWVMTGGSVIGVLAVVGWSQVTNVAQYYVTAAFLGVAVGASTYEAAFSVIVAVVDRERRDATILWLTLVTAFSSAFYYPLTGALEAWLGWRSTLLVLAGVMAVAIPLHFWVLPGRRVHRARAAVHRGLSVGAALRDGRFWLLAAAFVLEAAAAAGVMIMLVTYLLSAGHPRQTAATLPLLVGVLSVPIRLGLGRAARAIGMTAVSAIGFTVQALGAGILWWLAGPLWSAALGIAAFGFGTAVATIARPAILADRYGPAQYAGITAVTAVLIALARAGAPLAATSLPGRGFLVAGAAVSLASAVILATLRHTPDAGHDLPAGPGVEIAAAGAAGGQRPGTVVSPFRPGDRSWS